MNKTLLCVLWIASLFLVWHLTRQAQQKYYAKREIPWKVINDKSVLTLPCDGGKAIGAKPSPPGESTQESMGFYNNNFHLAPAQPPIQVTNVDGRTVIDTYVVKMNGGQRTMLVPPGSTCRYTFFEDDWNVSCAEQPSGKSWRP